MAPDVHFTPVPERVLAEMLRLAAVGAGDVVYDLGCGDGRILAAAAECGAAGVGVDIDPERVAASRARIDAAGWSERVICRQENFFATDLRPATVVALYLLDSLNVRLRPKILAECAPGTRIVSYSFEMGEWECDAHTPIAANGVSLWIVPADLAGDWAVAETGEQLRVEQSFQKLAGHAGIAGKRRAISGRVAGKQFEMSVPDEPGAWKICGQSEGDCLQAIVRQHGSEKPWTARRPTDPAAPGSLPRKIPTR